MIPIIRRRGYVFGPMLLPLVMVRVTISSQLYRMDRNCVCWVFVGKG